ncbi:MAG TPA: hypothetical protein VGN32_14555 [Ktedonobacterales bacterium]|jgi:hypothetical protein|nr:hypothetical protein [Ktedonobacterales bacterium]
MGTPGGFATRLRQWGWVGLCLLGAVGLMVGGWFLINAHATVPVRIDGRVADYERITSGPAYLRNDLRLSDDGHTYTLDAGQFHPGLPDQLYQNGKTTLWVDRGTSTIVAITLYDQNDANPVTATTPAFDHPDLATQTNQQNSFLVSGVSLVLLLAALGWALLLLRAMRQRQSVELAPAYRDGRGAPVARGAREGYR